MYSPNRQSTVTPNYGNSVAARAAAPGQQAKLARNLMGRPAMPAHADGAVVAPESSPWEKLWKIITGKSTQEALGKAANPTGPPPMTPPSDDISVVRRAAEEAGKRNEEASNKQPNIKKYCNGGVVR